MWELDYGLRVSEKVVLIEDGKVLALSHSGKRFSYSDPTSSYYDTEKEAYEARDKKIEYIREMMPKVRKFIESMEFINCDGVIKFDRSDYLGSRAKTTSYYKDYEDESTYAHKLETFIRSRMVNIGGCMIPFDGVRSIEWHAEDDDVDEYEDDGWKAVLETAEGKYETENEIEVRLVKIIFGCNAGVYFVDDK